MFKNKIIFGIKDFLKKVRFIVKGYKQIFNINYINIYIVVLKIYTFKIFMVIVVLRDWEMFSLDITMVFFYRFINEEIYIE